MSIPLPIEEIESVTDLQMRCWLESYQNLLMAGPRSLEAGQRHQNHLESIHSTIIRRLASLSTREMSTCLYFALVGQKHSSHQSLPRLVVVDYLSHYSRYWLPILQTFCERGSQVEDASGRLFSFIYPFVYSVPRCNIGADWLDADFDP